MYKEFGQVKNLRMARTGIGLALFGGGSSFFLTAVMVWLRKKSICGQCLLGAGLLRLPHYSKEP